MYSYVNPTALSVCITFAIIMFAAGVLGALALTSHLVYVAYQNKRHATLRVPTLAAQAIPSVRWMTPEEAHALRGAPKKIKMDGVGSRLIQEVQASDWLFIDG